MNSLKNDFLKRSVAALENLASHAESEAILSPEFIREAFRTLHTIKGTAQTFGFSNSSKIAHELENLLSDAKKKNDFLNDDFKLKLLEEIACLVDSFTKNDNVKARTSLVGKTQKVNNLMLPYAPEFLNQFSEHEKKEITEQINQGKNIFLVNADFDAKNFAEGFKNLREKLSEKGEIIAALPNQNGNENNKISFRICFASEKNESTLRKSFVKTTSVSRLVKVCNEKQPDCSPLSDILTQIAAHGKDLAKKNSKQIDFEISAEKIELLPEKLNLIFEILLHLTRNAIDHAFDAKSKVQSPKSKVQISIKSEQNGLKLSVEDNGKGIDTEKIRAKAIEKKLISSDKTLTTREMLDLIFLHDFSTAEVLTEISGRGVGLDAVKKMVENACGTINVKSRRESGTIFEVILRYEK